MNIKTMHRSVAYFVLISCITFFLISCTYHDLEPPTFQVTQAQLNAAVIQHTTQDTSIVGDPFNVFSGDAATVNHKLRDLFDNLPIDKSISVGTILVRRAYYYPNSKNKRDSLLNTVVMVKRESGYFPEGGDWEYMDIKYDQANNYILNPNGVLPEISNVAARGKIMRCANCHALSARPILYSIEIN